MGTSGPSTASTGQEPSGGEHPNRPGAVQSSGNTGQEPKAPNTVADDLDQESDPAKLRSMLKAAREDSAKHRAAAKELEDYKARAEAATMSDLQKAQKDAAEKTAAYNEVVMQLQQIRVERAIEKAAAEHGIIDAEAAAKLIDWSQLEFNDDGIPKNASKLLKQLAESKPYLVNTGANANGQLTPQPARATGGGTTNPSGMSRNEPLTWELIQQLGKDPAAYNARRAEIQDWLSRQRFR